VIRTPAAALLCLAALLASAPAQSEVPAPAAIDAALARVRARLARTRQEAEAARARAASGRLALIKKISDLRKKTRAAEAEARTLRAKIESLEEKRRSERAYLERESRAMAGLVATLRRGLKTLVHAEEASLVCLEHPELIARCRRSHEALMNRDEATVEEVETLLETLRRYLVESRRVARFSGEVADAGGRIRRMEICRLGLVAAYYQDGARCGHLQLDDTGHWQAVGGEDDGTIRSVFVAGEGDRPVPLDPSGGLAIRENHADNGLLDRLEAGGPVMIPIGLLVVLALGLMLERLLFLVRARRSLRRLKGVVPALARGERPDAVRERLRGHNGLLAAVLTTVLDHPVGGEAAVDQALREQAPALERSLGLLGVLGTVAPFLGLLGTVTGLITTFGALTAFGSNDPRLLASGISEALITTQAGLIVAIPILLVHAFLSNRVDDVSDRLEDAAEAAATACAGAEDRA